MPIKAKTYRQLIPMISQPDARGSAASRGYDSRWAKFRAAYQRRNPLCVQWKRAGIIRPATQVDHIKPLSAGGDKYNESNLQGLCATCHSKKTARERCLKLQEAKSSIEDKT